MTQIELRPVTPDDRPRILEISARIWEGHDYVPELLDAWFADTDGEIVGAVLGGQLAGFAHRTWLAPGLAWLEGIRTDPAYQGKGAGRAITEHLIERASDAGASRISLSTYIDNVASIHVIESCGFERVATFVYQERPADAPPVEGNAETDPRIVSVSEKETIEFVANSAFLRLARCRFPRGWRFFPFDRDPTEAIARMSLRLGVRGPAGLEALLCSRRPPGMASTVFNFLDGEPEAMRRLLRYALGQYPDAEIAMMIPSAEGRVAVIDSLLDEFDFVRWGDGEPDVFLYELPLEKEKDARRPIDYDEGGGLHEDEDR